MEGMYIIPQNTLQPSRFLLENIDVYCIFESSDEEVWIGTRMQGLYRLKDNVLQKVPYALTGSAGIRNMQIWKQLSVRHGNGIKVIQMDIRMCEGGKCHD